MLPRSHRPVPVESPVVVLAGVPVPAPVGRRARLAARLRATALDRALIAGADPACAPALAARASLLASQRSRERIAEGLEQLVWRAERPQRRWWALAHRRAILANAAELRALSLDLHGERPCYAAGLARLHQLLIDGSGPAYRGEAAGLSRALRDAREALDGAA